MTIPTRGMKRAAIALVVLLTVGFAVGSLAGTTSPDSSGVDEGLTKVQAYGGDLAASREAAMAPSVTTQAGVAPGDTTQDASSVSPFGDRVIRDARLTVEVPDGSFDAAWDKARAIAAELGGEIVDSQRGTDGDRPILDDGARQTAFGTITIRVPARDLDIAMRRFSTTLGEVRHETTSSQDVSEEYVDLKARLRNLRTEESALLDLYARASSVRDTLIVRERLSEVRGEIEQTTGRIRFIDNRTAFSTLTLTIAEPGGIFTPLSTDEPSFARAWDTALEGLVRIGTTAMITGIWLAPFAALGALILGLRKRTPPAPQV